MVVTSAAGVFFYQWNHTGPHPLSSATAYQRFRSGTTGAFVDPGTLRPHEGVYSYRGARGTSTSRSLRNHRSKAPAFLAPSGTGPTVAGSGASTTAIAIGRTPRSAPADGNLVEVGRAGWYRWNLVALSIADTGTYSCSPEVAIPAVLHVGQQFPFVCTGTSSPIKTGVVTMKGTNRYVGPQTLRIGGTDVPTLHFREESTLSGGQWGSNVSDTWFSTVNGLPVKGTWTHQGDEPHVLGELHVDRWRQLHPEIVDGSFVTLIIRPVKASSTHL